jgi:hypothetical protein
MKNRRDFIKTLSNASAGAIIMPGIISCGRKGKKAKSPNELINIGMIGVGSHGFGHNLKAYLNLQDYCRVVAICDVYKPYMQRAKNEVDKVYGNKDCKVYSDFRELLADPNIDAVQISTPDHWHVPISIIAANSGKHVSCEKPMHSIEEGQMLKKVMKETGLIFAVSVEDRFVPVYHNMAELVKNGRIGELEEIYIELPERDTPTEGLEITAPPSDLDYEMWTGPAPMLPYCLSRCIYHFRWHKYYSGGMVTDWLTHMGETAKLIFNFDNSVPLEVEPLQKTIYHTGIFNTPHIYDVNYKYSNGKNLRLKTGKPLIRCKGSEGWIESPSWSKPLHASDKKLLEPLSKNKIAIPTDKSEHVNFLNSIISGEQAIMNPKEGHDTSVMCHLANIAMDLDRKIVWNAEDEVFINDDEANARKSITPREKWSYEKILKMKC